MKEPPPNVLELPLEVRAEMAMNAAVGKAIEERARLALPIYIWRDGKVVEIRAKGLGARIVAGGPEELPEASPQSVDAQGVAKSGSARARRTHSLVSRTSRSALSRARPVDFLF